MLVATSEVIHWHWALRLSFDLILDEDMVEPTITVALGPWVGCVGLRWYR